MAVLPALDASVELELLRAWFFPVFEASGFSVADVIAFKADYDVLFGAIFSLMADFIAFKTHFFITIK